jgi:hypothetical protein
MLEEEVEEEEWDEIDENELLEALEEEQDDIGAPGESDVTYAPARRKTLESLGDDLLMRIMGVLSVTQLCTLSGIFSNIHISSWMHRALGGAGRCGDELTSHAHGEHRCVEVSAAQFEQRLPVESALL